MAKSFAAVLIVFGGGVALAGCLFPDFDEVAGTGQGPGAASSSSSSSGNNGGDGGTSTSGEGGSGGGGGGDNTGVDGGLTNDGAPAAKPTIKCASTNGCDVGTSYCCVGITTPTSSCEPAGKFTGCAAAMFCDENKDCGPSMKCCISGTSARCQSTCDEIFEGVVCNPDDPDCPSNKTCKADMSGGGMTLFLCK
jgi:hypothetical protein